MLCNVSSHCDKIGYKGLDSISFALLRFDSFLSTSMMRNMYLCCSMSSHPKYEVRDASSGNICIEDISDEDNKKVVILKEVRC